MRFTQSSTFVLALALAGAVQIPLAATVSIVPEIDGGSMSVGLGLLAGGVLLLRARWRAR
jgi:hypothetical protein